MGKEIKVELTELEQSHLMDALITWEKEVNNKLKEESLLAESKGKVPLFGERFASTLVHDIKIKLNLDKGMEKNGIFSLNN